MGGLHSLRLSYILFLLLIGSIPVLLLTGCSHMQPQSVPCITNPTIVVDCTTPEQVYTCVCPNANIVWVEKLTNSPTPPPTPTEFLIKFKTDTPLKVNGIPLHEVPSSGGKTAPYTAYSRSTQVNYDYGFQCNNNHSIDPKVKVPPMGVTQCY